MLFLQGEQVILELKAIKLTLVDEVKFTYSSVFAFFISKEALDNRPKYFQFILSLSKLLACAQHQLSERRVCSKWKRVHVHVPSLKATMESNVQRTFCPRCTIGGYVQISPIWIKGIRFRKFILIIFQKLQGITNYKNQAVKVNCFTRWLGREGALADISLSLLWVQKVQTNFWLQQGGVEGLISWCL